MARHVVEKLIDDLDGSDGSETVDFTLDGKPLQIDLNEHNAGKLRDTLAPYVAAARRTGSPARSSSPSRPRTSTADRETNAAIRAWARHKGIGVSERGRLSNEIVAAYQNRATPDTAAATPIFQAPPSTGAQDKPK